MKESFLRILACPGCMGRFRSRFLQREGKEIMEGTLHCDRCGAVYPIVRGVPRFVPRGSYASSFGFQWNRFSTVQLDSSNRTRESARTMQETTGWTDDEFRGRLVLDAGAGAGRFAEIAAAGGAEVVGIDLSSAIDAAFVNVGRQEKVHLAQADIMNPPFREGTFDLAYSIGVLHHTPEPSDAFVRLGALVRKGGSLAVYLYARYGPGHHFSDALRWITTRLPLGMMFALSSIAVPLYYLYRVPVLGKLLQLVCPISMHRNWRWRWLDTFDWYTPRYQWKFLYPEVIRWFKANRFLEIEVFDDPIRMRGIKAG